MTDTDPVPVCITTVTAPCRLIVRASTPGIATAWPMLVADPCPWALYQGFGVPHAHVHYMTEPGPPWLRLAPCCRRPYLLTIEAA